MKEQTNQESAKQDAQQESSLQLALAKLQDRQLDKEQVKRVAVERQGVIHLEVHEAGKQRYFVYQADELRELQPENDSGIPLVSELHEHGCMTDQTIVSYRPGRRIVLGPAGSEAGNITKGYRKHRAEIAAQKYAIALSTCGPGAYDVPELLHYQVDKDYLRIAKRSGQPPEIQAGAAGVWAEIGSRLRRFQQSGITDGLLGFNCYDELAVLDERARRFELCLPSLPQHWGEGREQLEEAVRNLPPAVKGMAHRDLHDRQFIVAGNTISLLDFDQLCIADVALDAGNLMAHVKLRVLQRGEQNGAAAESACSKAFLTGLGRQDESGVEQRLLFFQATTFYRLALLYALRPQWAHLTDSLIAEGRRCIDAVNESQGRP